MLDEEFEALLEAFVCGGAVATTAAVLFVLLPGRRVHGRAAAGASSSTTSAATATATAVVPLGACLCHGAALGISLLPCLLALPLARFDQQSSRGASGIGVKLAETKKPEDGGCTGVRASPAG
jgi:hypothetical protein